MEQTVPELEALPAVSVLLSSKDRRELLCQAVASLRELDYPPDRLEIVVVEETDSPKDPGADRYVPLPRWGKGFAWSRNAALQAATHPLVAFTDDDCRVDRHWLRELVAPFRSPTVAAVAGGVLSTPCGLVGKTEIVLGFPGGGLKRIFKADDEGWSPTRDLSTVNSAARRERLEELGGFCEATGIYGGEDSELFGRLTEGHLAVFNPRALVYHRARDSFPRIAKWFFRRGIAAVALAHLDRRRRGGLLLEHLRNSLVVRGAIVIGVLLELELPMLFSLLLLAVIYYAAMTARYRFAGKRLGFSVLLLTPITKLVMDSAFEAGRLWGLALWMRGRLGGVADGNHCPEAVRR